jgi:hypothetical protein
MTNKNKNTTYNSNQDQELHTVDDVNTLETKRRLVQQQLEEYTQQIIHKEVDLQFHTNALKLFLNYKVDDISTVIEKGHELFTLQQDLKDLRSKYEKLVQNQEDLMKKIQRSYDGN